MTAWRVRGIRLPGGEDIDAGITADGRWTNTPPPGADPFPGRFVLPGLVDAHSHLSVAGSSDGWPLALGLDGARENLLRAAQQGVTTVRDTGSPASVTLELLPDADGGLLACGRFLAPPGRYIPTLLHEGVPAEGLVDAALAEIAAGARWVKLVADFPTLTDGRYGPPVDPTYPLVDIERLVAAVHAAGARVAAHTTTRFVADLVAVGVDSIEHGNAIDESDLGRLAARGGAWTPTLCAKFGDRPDADPAMREHLSHCLSVAVVQGVTIMTGTDVVGTIAGEVALLGALGLPPADALAAASTSARSYLGLADFADGAPADLVSYHDDPRTDPAVLANPAAVVARGRRIR